MKKDSCPYCGCSPVRGMKRCQECDSWLSLWSYLSYPVTLVQLAAAAATVILAIVSANYAYQQAADARRTRAAADLNLDKSVIALQEAEKTKRDITIVAENVTKMALLLMDGSGRFGGIPEEYKRQIKMYERSLSPYLPRGIDAEVQAIISRFDTRVRRGGDGRP